ncbi:hypothetical protein JCM18899A_36870 [Nocardioides sp. AN3]
MRPGSEHRDALARRLDLLRAESEAPEDPFDDPFDDLRADPLGPPPADPFDDLRSDPLGDPPTDPFAGAFGTLSADRVAGPLSGRGSRPPAVPVPGRHVERRPAAVVEWLRDRAAGLVPETLQGRVSIGPWHVTVVALLVAVGLAITCWSVLRGEPDAVPAVTDATASPLVSLSAGASGAAGPSAGTTAAAAAGASVDASAAASPGGSAAAAPSDTSVPPPTGGPATLTIDVAGKVRRPGVIHLPAGSRVVDAIEAAGGARPGADLDGLNRARLLVDGEQILVGAPAVPPAGAASGAGSGSGGRAGSVTGTGVAPTGAPVNLNTATVGELDSLPGIGPVTAQAILDYRTQHGRFSTVDELLDVDGIGEATLSKLAPHVSVQ